MGVLTIQIAFRIILKGVLSEKSWKLRFKVFLNIPKKNQTVDLMLYQVEVFLHFLLSKYHAHRSKLGLP